VLARATGSFSVLEQVLKHDPDRRIQVSIEGKLNALPFTLAIGGWTTRHN
jgi:hypothetical protein